MPFVFQTPFARLTDVAWNDSYMVLTHTNLGSSMEPGEYELDGYQLVLMTPHGYQDIAWAGKRANQDAVQQYPANIIANKSVLFDLGGFSKLVGDSSGGFQSSMQMRNFVINPSRLWSMFSDDLKAEGTLGHPAAWYIGIYYGGSLTGNTGSVFGKMRIAWYTAAVLPYLDGFNVWLNSGYAASGVEEHDSANTNELFLDISLLPAGLLYQKTVDVVGAQATYGHKYDLWWDWANRNNSLAEPGGTRPNIESAAF